MGVARRFDEYLEHLSAGLGHADRVSGLRGYCTGLMQPLARKGLGLSRRNTGSRRCPRRRRSMNWLPWPIIAGASNGTIRS